MHNPVRRHLDEVGESYPTHLAAASGLGLRMISAGLACLVHGLLPFVFVHTASDAVRRLDRRLAARRTQDEHWVI